GKTQCWAYVCNGRPWWGDYALACGRCFNLVWIIAGRFDGAAIFARIAPLAARRWERWKRAGGEPDFDEGILPFASSMSGARRTAQLFRFEACKPVVGWGVQNIERARTVIVSSFLLQCLQSWLKERHNRLADARKMGSQ